MSADYQYPQGVPTEFGFYWAIWKLADDGTFEGPGYTQDDKDGVMSHRWEVVELVESVDHSDDEWLKVSVSGVGKSQSPENFIWGSKLASYPPKHVMPPALFSDLLRRLKAQPDDASAIMSNNYRTVLRALETACGEAP